MKVPERSAHVSFAARSAIYTVLVLFTVATLYPLFWLVLSSFKSNRDFQLNPLGWPETWHFQNYALAWRTGDFTRLFINSILYSGLAATLTILLALAADPRSKLQSRATPILYGSFVIGILLTIQSILVPLFLVANWVGLYNTFWAVLIVYVGVSVPHHGIFVHPVRSRHSRHGHRIGPHRRRRLLDHLLVHRRPDVEAGHRHPGHLDGAGAVE